MPERPRRRDAQQNRERIVTAAATVIADDGPDASLDKIATRAGVGAGTLYRHFPTRSDLLAAVFEGRIIELSDRAVALCDHPRPGVALAEWVAAMLDHALTDNGLLAALALTGTKPEIDCSAMILRAADTVLERAQDAGEIRRDVTADDLLRLIVGIGLANDERVQAHRLLNVTLDGLRRAERSDP
jgi:AcrR family transcriptional regulator